MLYNYFKVTFRNIWRSKVNSIINILGLAVGIACAILIVLFVKDEVTFDQFHSKIDRLYRVTTTMSRDGDGEPGGMTPFVVGLTVKDEIQDVESAIVLTSYNDMVEHGETKFRELITIVGSDFFNMFDFKVLDGSSVGALDKVTDLVLTKDMAEKYFGRVDVAGENLSINAGGEQKEYLVTAVVDNVPSNSSLQFGLLVNDDNLKFLFQERQLNHWFMIAGEVYVLLREGSTAEATEAKFPEMVKKGIGEERFGRMQYENGLQPMADIHLGPQMNSLAPISDPKYTMILSAIAALILLIASINFITISLAKSINRSREIGVRKSVGALKTQLIWQFLLESTVLAFIALFLGLVLVWFTLPLFNDLAQKRLEFDLTGLNSLMFIGLTLAVAFLAGFYPAIVISGFKPTKILKGEVKVGSGKQSLRVIMVAGQFIVTIFLITSTLIMKKQIDFMQNTNLGFDKEQLLMVPLNVASSGGEVQQLIDGMEKGKRLKLMLDQEPTLASVSLTSLSFGPGSWININFEDENEEERDFFMNTVEPNYINTLGMKIVAGRDFEKDNEADKRRYKLNNDVIKLWSKILHKAKNAKLMIVRLSINEHAIKYYVDLFKQEGIDKDRLIFIGETPLKYSDYPNGTAQMAIMSDCDIILDSFPYSNHTIACEALWMGIPIITQYGNRHASRVCSTILNAIGHDELITYSETEYIDKAIELGNNKQRLVGLRNNLRGEFSRSRLMNFPAFTKELESAYKHLWGNLCNR